MTEVAAAPTAAGSLADDVGAVVRANRQRATALVVSVGVVAGVVVGVVLGLVVGLVVGVVAAVVAAIVVAAVLWWAAPWCALRLVRARPIAGGDEGRLENLVDGLCATFGIRAPRLMIVSDEVANACALGTSRQGTFLVVTTALLENLDLIELEGVVAHELAHIKRGDALVSSVAAVVLGPLAWLSGDDRRLHKALGLGREFRADDVAVSTVRYPPGLQRALEEMAGATPSPGSLFSSRRILLTRWIWVNPILSASTPVATSTPTSDLPTQSTVGGSVSAPGAAGPPARNLDLGLADQLDLPGVRAAALAQR